MIRQLLPSLMFRIALATAVGILALSQASAAKPNVIFILADDLGYGDLGCFGQEKIQTPHLDRMAAEGMKLTSFYAGSTVCAPSRCVLMTGKHTGRARVRGNARLPLLPEDYTVAELFKDAGYQTALCGKWGLGEPGTSGIPTQQGFDFFYGYLNQRHAHNYYPEFLYRNEDKVRLNNTLHPDWLDQIGGRENNADGAGYAIDKNEYSHDLIMREALNWMEHHHSEPFFLYLALTIPHANNEGSRGTGNGQEVPDYGIYTDLDWPDPDKGQAAMVSRMDRDIGRLFQQLKAWGIDEQTLVIFTSDNGHHQEGGNRPEFFDANGPLRGMKRDLYEGGIRVPTLARWPGKIQAGSWSDHPAYFGDLFATACELLDVEVPDGLQSVSFLPSLFGQGYRQPEHDYLYWEFYERGGRQAVRFGKWKAVRMPPFSGRTQLYDLSKDLGETQDLAVQYPAVVTLAETFMSQAHVTDPNWVFQGRP